MVKVVILTGREIRHSFMRMRIAIEPDLNVLRTYCCGDDFGMLHANIRLTSTNQDIKLQHLDYRRQVEIDMFGDFIKHVNDYSNPVYAQYKAPNSQEVIDDIIALKPDLILVFGACILKEPIIKSFSGRILNAHLGLSPYYRGSGTNFWPLVNKEPEYVGCTFMYLDNGIDTGKIIHQIRPEMNIFDGPHQIGNRLIKKMSSIYADIALNFDRIVDTENLKCENERYYQNQDFTSRSVRTLIENFKQGMIKEYIENRNEIDAKIPTIKQKWLNQ